MSEQLAEEMSASTGVGGPEPVPVEAAPVPPAAELKAVEPTPQETAAQPITPAPADAAPFSGRGEFIDTDAPPATKKVEKIKSPEIVVHKDTQKMQADFTGLDRVEPASEQPFNEPFSRRADPDMLRKISELEQKVNTLEKENVALNDELKSSVDGAKQEQASIATDNWNLERATMKFNEAERQIKRLGEQVARERALCSGEKQDLESQLFDPRITDQRQLARLAELEQKLAEAERQLARMRATQGTGAAY